jgi:hypothetical protein
MNNRATQRFPSNPLLAMISSAGYIRRSGRFLLIRATPQDMKFAETQWLSPFPRYKENDGGG